MKKIISALLICAVIVVSIPVLCAGLATITVSNEAVNSSEIASGEKTVDLTVSMSNNPGIIGAIISVKYDSSNFALIKVDTNGVLSKASFDSKVISKASPAKSPYVLAWSGDTLPKNIKDNGVMATLTFKVNKDAPDGVYPIEISYDYDNYGIVNYNIQPVKFEMVNGSITVGKDAIPATAVPTSNATAVPTEKPTATPTDSLDFSDNIEFIYSDEYKAPTVENLNVSGVSIDVEKGLDLKFKVSKSLFDEEKGYSEPFVTCTFDGKKTKIVDYDSVGNYFVFTFFGVTPEKMGEPINVTLHGTKDDIAYAGTTYKCSVKDYCYDILKKHSDDEKLSRLMVDILFYGAAAQEYAKFDTENLVTNDLTDAQKALRTTDIPEVTTVFNSNVNETQNTSTTIDGAGLVLKDKLYLRYLINTDNSNGLLADVSFDGKQSKIDTITKCADGYYVFVPVNLTDLFKEMTISISYKDKTESNTVKYSVASYIYAMNNGTVELENLLNSLLKYYSSATEYLK